MILAARFWAEAWRFTTIVQVLVAAGTIGAAVGALLAVRAANRTVIEAGNEATASREQAVASEKQAAALLRPIIVDVPVFKRGPSSPYVVSYLDEVDKSALPLVNPGPSEGPVGIRVPIRNIGPGPGLLASVTFTADVTEAAGEPERGVIASGESSFLQITLPSGHEGFYGFKSRIVGRDRLVASLRYMDIGSTPYGVTFELTWDDSVDGYRVTNMIFRDDQGAEDT